MSRRRGMSLAIALLAMIGLGTLLLVAWALWLSRGSA